MARGFRIPCPVIQRSAWVMNRAPADRGLGLTHAGFVAGVQTISGRADVERNQTNGSTVLNLQLLCTANRGATLEQYPTLWTSLPMLEIRKPALSSCRAPCTPLIDHLAYVRGCAAAEELSRRLSFLAFPCGF